MKTIETTPVYFKVGQKMYLSAFSAGGYYVGEIVQLKRNGKIYGTAEVKEKRPSFIPGHHWNAVVEENYD